MITKQNLQHFIESALQEDVGSGDYTTLASIPQDAAGTAVLKIKQAGILAGVEIAKAIFFHLQPDIDFMYYKKDGETMHPGETAFKIKGLVHTILKGERLALNCMQRMCGIATLTDQYVQKIKNFHTRLLDTRKTTPNFRLLEKEAVRIGGGINHRMGLYDMIMLKDNHIDFCGGIEKAIQQVNNYLVRENLTLPIEIEVRSLDDLKKVLSAGGVNRVMLDNFSPNEVEQAVKLVDGQYETEASGGITLDNIEAYAKAGVDFISAGAVIHQAVSLDLSLKAVLS